MLILENTNHVKVAALPNAKDVKIERDLQGNDTLSFSYAMGVDSFYPLIQPQGFIVTPDQEYVIKEVNPDEENYADIVATVNTEDLKSTYNNAFVRENVQLTEIANNALVGTGWTVDTNVTKLRSLSMTNSTPLDILKKLAETYTCDIMFDAKNKIVKFSEIITYGVSNAYFVDKLNLASLQVQNTSYDFCTRLIPVGKDNLRITDVNAGLEYVENYGYSSQIILAYWQADQYTDAQALKDDAVDKLGLLSKPAVAYKANVRDLANLMPDSYSFLKYQLGDFIRVVDNEKQMMEIVRIVKTTDYPFDPENNEVELNSQYEQLEDLQLKFEQTADSVDTITTPDGAGVSGEKIDGVDWTKVQNVQVTNAQIQNLAVDTAKIKDLTVTTAKIADLSVTNAKIVDATITDAKIHDLSADKITAGTIDANFIRVINLNADWINAGTINANLIGAKTITGDKIAGNTITGDLIAAGTITAESGIIADAAIGTAQIQDLSVTGAKIAAATIDTVNIKNGAITTALIGTGAVDTAQIADGSITDAKIVSLTASKITAGTIDAGVINVINLNADNITVGTINGQRITDGTIDNSKIKDDANISGSKLNIDTVFDEMNNDKDIGYGELGYGETKYGGEVNALNDGKIFITKDGKTLDIVMADVTDRLNGVEIKVTPESIVSTVVESDDFHTVSSQIAQSAENIKIGFNGIDDNVVFDSDGLHVNHGSIDASLANITNINASNINTGLLQGDLIAANTITGDKIVADAITAREIATATITANEIAGHTITAAEIKTGTITASSGIIASIDAGKITTGTLDASKITVINLDADSITAGTISGNRISGGTITGTLLRTSSTSNYMYLHDQYIDIYNSNNKVMTLGYGFSGVYNYPKLSFFLNEAQGSGEVYVASMASSGELYTDIQNFSKQAYFYNGITVDGDITMLEDATFNGNIIATGIIRAERSINAEQGIYNVGKMPAYTKTTTLVNNGSGNIYHGLGYYPIVSISGTVGNIIMTYNYVDDDNIRFHCYSSGGSSWSGTIYLW